MTRLRGVPSHFATAALLALLAMLGAQALLELHVLAPLAAQVQQARLARAVQSKPSAVAPGASPPLVRLDTVLTRLQEQPDNQARIERLHRIADQQGVVLRKASYLPSKSGAGELLRHEMQADLAGNYPAIRQFLHEALAQDEALVLESLEFSRPPGTVGVRAQVRLVMVSRP